MDLTWKGLGNNSPPRIETGTRNWNMLICQKWGSFLFYFWFWRHSYVLYNPAIYIVFEVYYSITEYNLTNHCIFKTSTYVLNFGLHGSICGVLYSNMELSAVPCKIWTCVFVPGGQDEQGRGTQHGLTGVCAMRPCVYVTVASSVHSANRENWCARAEYFCVCQIGP